MELPMDGNIPKLENDVHIECNCWFYCEVCHTFNLVNNKIMQ